MSQTIRLIFIDSNLMQIVPSVNEKILDKWLRGFLACRSFSRIHPKSGETPRSLKMPKSPFKGVGSGAKRVDGMKGGIDSFSENMKSPGGSKTHSKSHPSTPGKDPVGFVGNPKAFNPKSKKGY